MLRFVAKVSGEYLSPGQVKMYMKELGENYPVIVKTFRGERSAVSLKKLSEYKDGVKEAWFPSKRNWEMISEHGMEKLERIADSILQYWN